MEDDPWLNYYCVTCMGTAALDVTGRRLEERGQSSQEERPLIRARVNAYLQAGYSREDANDRVRSEIRERTVYRLHEFDAPEARVR